MFIFSNNFDQIFEYILNMKQESFMVVNSLTLILVEPFYSKN